MSKTMDAWMKDDQSKTHFKSSLEELMGTTGWNLVIKPLLEEYIREYEEQIFKDESVEQQESRDLKKARKYMKALLLMPERLIAKIDMKLPQGKIKNFDPYQDIEPSEEASK